MFLTQAHPKQTQGSDVYAGISLDQLYAQRFGQDTPIPSMQLCIENVDQAGGCGYGYSCVYTDTISWASPTQPLPMIRDPRVVFDSCSASAPRRASARERRDEDQQHPRLAARRSVGRLQKRARRRPTARGWPTTSTNVREIERRIQASRRATRSGEQRELPGAPVGVPDSFDEHVKLMFDLQVLAFASDMTRVFSFKLGRDASNRTYPESGFNGAFHNASHHGEREDTHPATSRRSTRTTSAWCRTSSRS